MIFTPRDYQQKAIDIGIDFFEDNTKRYNALEILPTGSGKSLVIANIVNPLKEKTIILQPSKEILEQNYAKYMSYGGRASIYSASAGSKHIGMVTYATIGSVINKIHLFKDYKNIVIDECHLVSAEFGMYNTFIKKLKDAKVLGLTATPYRLTSTPDGAMLDFLNRSEPRIFKEIIYYIQNQVLFDQGHLAKLKYINFDVVDREMLQMNAKGTDFTDASIQNYYRKIDMPTTVAKYANKLLRQRKNLLVFCSLISEAQKVATMVPGSVVLTGDTEPSVRSKMLAQFKNGLIKCIVNCSVLTTGFDYPELECVLMARSTMSLALYYQIAGRIMRPHKDKHYGWFVDLGGNIKKFGKIETMIIKIDKKGEFSVWNDNRQLTNVAFQKS